MPIETHEPEEVEEQDIEMEWLADHSEVWSQYRGQWIAIVGERIVAAGDDVLAVWQEAKKVADDPLFFLVPPEPPLIL